MGTLTWTPRDGTAQVIKNLVRYAIGSTVQPPPAFAPATGTYLLNPTPGGILVFPEMQGSGPPLRLSTAK